MTHTGFFYKMTKSLLLTMTLAMVLTSTFLLHLLQDSYTKYVLHRYLPQMGHSSIGFVLIKEE